MQIMIGTRISMTVFLLVHSKRSLRTKTCSRFNEYNSILEYNICKFSSTVNEMKTIANVQFFYIKRGTITLRIFIAIILFDQTV